MKIENISETDQPLSLLFCGNLYIILSPRKSSSGTNPFLNSIKASKVAALVEN